MTDLIVSYQKIIAQALSQFKFPKEPKNLYDPLNYFLTLGGKRMRPILTLMGTELFDKEFEKATSASLAVELFHNFSLIHDDIMDEAPLRRGKETVHTKWNTSIGILSGDALLIESYKLLGNYPPEILAKLFPLFNKTALEVCEGQQWDMDFETMDEVTITSYIKMIAYKTAVLLGCSLEMGAIIGGASEEDGKDLYQFGLNLGIAFQIQDDILDVYADQNKFGKQVGGDIISNKKTFLLLKAYEDANTMQVEQLRALATETDYKKKVQGVKEIYEHLSIREKAEKKMNEYHDLAMKNLLHINVSEDRKEPLRQLSDFLLNREH